MSRPTQAVINLAALQNNIDKIKQCVPSQKIMAVVKANAYGHGASEIAKALAPAVQAFAVCSLEEALGLRQAGIQLPILLLEGFFDPKELPEIVQQGCEIVVHSPEQVAVLRHYSQPLPSLWIKVDTGMHRLGFSVETLPTVYQQLQDLLVKRRLFSHLACADDLDSEITFEQIARFKKLVQTYNLEASLANSAGILGWPTTHWDWVRPGIMLYGASPILGTVAYQHHLQPVMTLRSTLISIKYYRQGDSIGYGASWQCPKDTRIGIVAIGYADGYPRHAPVGTPVLVNGQRVPLVGRVSMDMITVDLRKVPEAQVHDPVVLWGEGLAVEEVANSAGTIAYQLLSGITSRVKRIVVNCPEACC